tara:strand:- start:4653 stop:7553 length:2901 start_codon:yes stop_codon:yes gene_type:complete
MNELFELFILLCLAAIGVLIALIFKMSRNSGDIKALEQKLRDLEARTEDLARSSTAAFKNLPPAGPTQAPLEANIPIISEKSPNPAPESTRPQVTRPKAQASLAAQPAPAIPPKSAKQETVAADPHAITFLRRIGLWPPVREGGSAELALIQWWTPRLAGALGILSITFFAVYVAQGTPPWVKFIEMIAISMSVFALGLFSCRRRPAFGNVLVATGLAMIYISCVAGYAVGPVKIVETPILGALMQLAALALNFGMGIWRKERGILVLAIIFGYFSSLFAALEGFREAALISSLLIYLAGLFSYRRIGGLTLASLSLAGVYLPLGGFVGINFIKDAPVYPHFWPAMLFLLAAVSIMPAYQWRRLQSRVLEEKWNRLYQSVNTSLALGLGYLFFNQFYPLQLPEFYGVTAIAFLTWSGLWFFRNSKGIEFHVFFLKGSALASLWFINELHGDLRWIALGIQVILLASSVHRSKSVWLEAIALLTWFVSFRYFAPELDSIESTGSFLWFIQLAYILLSIAGLGYLMAYSKGEKLILRRILYSIPALLLAISSIAFAIQSKMGGFDHPATVASMAALAAVIGFIPVVGKWIPIMVGSIVFIISHIIFWSDPAGIKTVSIVLAVSAGGILGTIRLHSKRRHAIETAIHLLWVLTTVIYLKAFEDLAIYPIVMVCLCYILLLGGLSPAKRMAEVAAMPLLLLLLFEPQAIAYPPYILLLSALLIGILANAGIIQPRLKSFIRFQAKYATYWWVLNGLFLYWTHWALQGSMTMTHQFLIWTLLGAVYYALWQWRGELFSLVMALVFAAIPVIRIVDLWLNPMNGGLMDGAPWAGQVLVAGLCSMLLWITLGACTKLLADQRLSSRAQELLAWVCGMTAFIVFAASFQYPLLNLDHLYTPLLAVFSIGLIVLGIVLKSRPYRYVAILSFVVPVYRLFACDIRETLYRIIAFAVLAIFLTLVAFLYQKFSSRIE